MFVRSALIASALLLAARPGDAQEAAGDLSALPAPAGTYTTDPAHTRLLFSVSHLGFSDFIALFLKAEATLEFDPDQPETMQLEARVDPASVETFYPDPAVDFDGLLAGPDFLDAAQYPEITFKSTAIRLVGDREAEVTGDLTLHGVTRPAVMQVRFNGGYAGHPLDAGARIGFSATGKFLRSDYGISFGVPVPGTTIGMGDEVTFRIETELLNPGAPKAP